MCIVIMNFLFICYSKVIVINKSYQIIKLKSFNPLIHTFITSVISMNVFIKESLSNVTKAILEHENFDGKLSF